MRLPGRQRFTGRHGGKVPSPLPLPLTRPLCIVVALLSLVTSRPHAAGNRPLIASSQRSSVTIGSYVGTLHTTEAGLPQHEVTTVMRTRNGYLWIGTLFGIVRFDGIRFSVFDELNSPGFNEDTVNAIAEDSQEHLWIGTSHGLCEVVGTNLVTWDRRRNLPFDRITAVTRRGQGSVWAAGNTGIVGIRQGAIDVFIPSPAPPDIPISNLLESSSGQLFAAIDGRWHAIEPAEKSIRPLPGGVLTPDDRADPVLLPTGDLHQWAATPEGLHERIGDHWHHRWAPADRSAVSYPVAIATTPGGDILALYQPALLIRYSPRTGAAEQWTVSSRTPPRWAHSMHADNDGVVWIGSVDGLLELRPRVATAWELPASPGHESVWSVAADPQDTVWFATDNAIFRHRNQTVEKILEMPGNLRWPIIAIPDSTDGVWASLGDRGLHRWGPDTGLRLLPTNSVSGRRIRALATDSAGYLWVGAQPGLARLKDGIESPVGFEPSLSHATVVCILESRRRNQFWFGTSGQGIYHWDGKILHRYTDADGLADLRTYTLHEDSKHRIWAAGERGLSALVGGRFRTLSRGQGLTEGTVNQILEHDRHLWLSGLRGIHRISMARLETWLESPDTRISITTIDRADGMPTSETNGEQQPAGCRDRRGLLWFPTALGLVSIDPSKVRTRPTTLPVNIEQVRINDSVILGDSLMHFGTNAIPELAVPAEKRDAVQIRYSSGESADAAEVRFRYQLSGVSRTWVEAGTEREIQFNNLAPGRYRFQVQALSAESNPISEAANLLLIVHAKWWESRPFRAFCILAGGLAILVLTRSLWVTSRQRLLSHRQALEAERTRIAHDLHDDVGANLTGLALKAELAGLRLPPDLAPEMESFAREARTLVDHLREVIWAVNPECDTLESLVSYVVDHAEKFLDRAGISCRLDIPDRVPEIPIRAEVRHQLLMVLKEALNNASRHGGATAVNLQVRLDPTALAIEVEDDGIGFESDAPDTSAERARSDPGLGLGLESMRARVQSLGGRLQISSQPGVGTRLQITLPYRAALPDTSRHRDVLATIEKLSHSQGYNVEPHREESAVRNS